MIDNRAIIADDAQIGKNVTIGANAIIGNGVKICDNVTIMPNAYLEYCEIGDGTMISPFASIGNSQQDLRFKTETTKSIIGKNCIIKEYATVNRAATEGDATIVGDRCMLMTSTHVAHNCVLEDEVIMATLATLGGHCHVGKGAFLGGMSVFHQNVRIGEMCIISGFSAARMDCLPYVKGEGRPPIPHGINSIGLKRRGIDADVRAHLKEALKILKSGEYTITKACDVIEQNVEQDEYVKKFVQFIRDSKRGITLRKAENTLC